MTSPCRSSSKADRIWRGPNMPIALLCCCVIVAGAIWGHWQLVLLAAVSLIVAFATRPRASLEVGGSIDGGGGDGGGDGGGGD